MLNDLNRGKDKRLIATKFHNSMAEIIIGTVKKLSKTFGIKDIALSGGVFQNNFLKLKVIKQLVLLGFNVFTNVEAPVNDFNISLGQYYVSCSTGKG
jgi:hydrogenase maturation protein HypF